MFSEAETSLRRMGLSVRASGAVARDYTTKLENTHGTTSWERLYPWVGRRVGVYQAVDKQDGLVFRCSLSGRVRLEINVS